MLQSRHSSTDFYSPRQKRGLGAFLKPIFAVCLLIFVLGGGYYMWQNTQFEQEKTQASHYFFQYKTLVTDIQEVQTVYESGQFFANQTPATQSDDFYANLQAKIQKILQNQQTLQTSLSTAQFDGYFRTSLLDATSNIGVYANQISTSITSDQCARSVFVDFQETQANLDAEEKALGNSVIILNADTSVKLLSLASHYSKLSDFLPQSLNCFNNASFIATNSPDFFTEESKTYATISQVLTAQAAAVNNLELFNQINRQRPATYTVYFQQTMPIWLEENSSTITKNTQKIEVNFTTIQTFFTEKYQS